jgi:hypothetical protein
VSEAVGARRAYLINGTFGHLCGPNRESQLVVQMKRLVPERRSQKGGFLSFEMMQRMTGMRKYRSFADGSANGSNRP